MSETKFTPGPWFYDDRTEAIGSPAGWVANVPSGRSRKSDTPFGDHEADARLIAQVPAMLRELRKARDYISAYDDETCPVCHTRGGHDEGCIVQSIDDVLAAVEGEGDG